MFHVDSLTSRHIGVKHWVILQKQRLRQQMDLPLCNRSLSLPDISSSLFPALHSGLTSDFWPAVAPPVSSSRKTVWPARMGKLLLSAKFLIQLPIDRPSSISLFIFTSLRENITVPSIKTTAMLFVLLLLFVLFFFLVHLINLSRKK